MTAAYDFHKVGRAVLEKQPDFFKAIHDEIQDCQHQSIDDVSLINTYFLYFCQYKNVSPDELRAVTLRSTLPVIALRRLFIGIVISEFDKLFLMNYAGRMKDGVRKGISDCLNCLPEWVSNVADSIKVELSYLKGYEDEVQQIVDVIRPQALTHQGEAPEFINTRHSHQFSLFE